MEFPRRKQSHPGQPLVPLPVTCIEDLSPGDHILYLVGEDGYRKQFRSALVSEVNQAKNEISFFIYTHEGVQEETCNLTTLHQLHCISYSHCRYSVADTLARAHTRSESGDELYNPLNNNGHHFVTHCKTGIEYPLSDMLIDLKEQSSEEEPKIPTPVAFKRKLKDITDIKPGQHLLIESFPKDKHVLVISCDYKGKKFTAFYYSGKIKIMDFDFSILVFNRNVTEITYDPIALPTVSAEEAIKRAEMAMQQEKGGKSSTQSQTQKRDDDDTDNDDERSGAGAHSRTDQASAEKDKKTSKPNHSSAFVTEMKTGIQCTLNNNLENLFCHDVSPVSLTPITEYTPVDEGDHIIVKTSDKEYKHAIVIRSLPANKVLAVPNISGDSSETAGAIQLTPDSFRVNYPQNVSVDETKSRAFTKKAERILQEQRDVFFATWAKTGKPQSVDIPQLKTKKHQLKQIRPIGMERVTSFTDIKVGDHLIQGEPLHWFHFIVSELVSERTHNEGRVKGIYCLRTKVSESEFTVEFQNHFKTLYRIKYVESFSPEKAIERARNELGKRKGSPLERMRFIRWVKTGSNESIEVQYLQNLSLPLSKSQIHSFFQLSAGDVVVQAKSLTKFDHYYIVTSVISSVKCEVVESYYGVDRATLVLDLKDEDTLYYRLNYHPEACFDPQQSVRMAEYLADNHSHWRHPIDGKKYTRNNFFNYVKTGDSTTVSAFDLSNDRQFTIRHKKVSSARELFPGDHIIRPLGSKVLRSSLKTDESFQDSITQETQLTASKGKKGNAVDQKVNSQRFHHMMVAERPTQDDACLVYHFGKAHWYSSAKILKSNENIFQKGDDVYRLIYPERVSPVSGLIFLSEVVQSAGDQATPARLSAPSYLRHFEESEYHAKEKQDLKSFYDEKNKEGTYSFLKSNCEHLIMVACVRAHVSPQIVDVIYKYLEYHCDVPLRALQLAIADKVKNIPVHAMSKFAKENLTSVCNIAGVAAGTAITRAVVRTTTRTIVTEGAEGVVETITTTGYNAALRSISYTVGGIFAFGASFAIETPLSIRNVYMLKRKEQYGVIDRRTFKKQCSRTVSGHIGTAIGGTAGAIGGTFIPVPVVGTVIGAVGGSLIGMAAGKTTGFLIGFAFQEEMAIDFADVKNNEYTDYSD